MAKIFKSIEKWILEFADYSFLNSLLNEYDTKALVYKIDARCGSGKVDDRYVFDGITVDIIHKNNIEINIYEYDVSDIEEVHTTFGELKCEWKKIAIDNLDEIRAERAKMH